MSKQPDIRFIKHNEIDKVQWDEKLFGCSNKLIYCESVFLDHVCPGWSALVQEDWKSLMPLPVKNKMGIRYAFQPPFCQQLGVFYANKDMVDAQGFVEEASLHAPLIDLNFNYSNKISIGEKYCNYIIDLSDSFADLKKNFRKDLISKAEMNHLVYERGSVDETIDAYIREVFPKTKGLGYSSISRFRNLCHHFAMQDRVICRKILSNKKESLSYALFLKDDSRIYYMLSASGSKGRGQDANAYLLHECIKEFSGTRLIFDFEGSEIPGVKFFFEKFSPQYQPYTRVRVNKLNAFQNGIRSIRDLIRK